MISSEPSLYGFHSRKVYNYVLELVQIMKCKYSRFKERNIIVDFFFLSIDYRINYIEKAVMALENNKGVVLLRREISLKVICQQSLSKTCLFSLSTD